MKNKFNTDALLDIDNALLVNTYDDYHEAIEKFAEGYFNFVLVVGRGGIGKSHSAEDLPNAVTITGQATGFGLYCAIAEEIRMGNPDPTIVISDLPPKCFRDPATQALLKDLTEKHVGRTIQWNSKAVEEKGYERQYQTSAKVLLLANSFDVDDEHMRAIIDRCSQVIVFEPTAYEVHKQAAAWFAHHVRDKATELNVKVTKTRINELFGFMYSQLPALPRNSHRRYQNLAEWYFAYPEKWRQMMLQSIYGRDKAKDDRMRLVLRLCEVDESDRQRGIKFAKAMKYKNVDSGVKQFRRVKEELGIRDDMGIGPPIKI